MKKNTPVFEDFDSYNVPPGQIRRRVGDVFIYSRNRYIVENVSASRAVARCLKHEKHKLKDKDTGIMTIADPTPAYISISACCDYADVIERVGGYVPAPIATTKTKEREKL